ncbi:MAG: sulfatase-like hydrolase/transferase [Paracoccaceae bacterium]
MVLVVGETGRSQSWSLDGYGRDTNPELARRDIVYFTEATSCGSATATSLPCMISALPQAEYSYEGGLASENLLDVLSHAGVHVEWWDNNTGSKAMAARIPSKFMSKEDDAAACAMGECTDAVFLPGLRHVAETMTEDTVIVLHQIGSHGPSYWLRYPPEDEVFQPACHSPELTSCSTEEIVNAYDNTIRYTDKFLAGVIDLLAESDRVAGAMYYVSDHGESLGENGLYLHGTPMFMAPAEQTSVPMVVWTSEGFRQGMGFDQGCLQARAAQPVSHDNLFSTVLGLMDIQTETREVALDLTAECPPNPS